MNEALGRFDPQDECIFHDEEAESCQAIASGGQFYKWVLYSNSFLVISIESGQII